MSLKKKIKESWRIKMMKWSGKIIKMIKNFINYDKQFSKIVTLLKNLETNYMKNISNLL
jgi:hypothetical protein